MLARELDVSDPTVSDAVGTLRRKGLVGQVQEPGDRRHRLSLTRAGQQVAQEVSRWTAPAEVATAGIDRAEDEQLLACCHVLERMHSAGLVGVTRACTTCQHFGRRPRRPAPPCTAAGSSATAGSIRTCGWTTSST